MNEASIAHSGEVRAAERFEFGRNWREFLHLLTEERIVKAENSLRDALGIQTLEDKTFLDVGSGSGLLSLAARRLGAEVRSFDYDPESVACTSELKSAFFSEDAHWRVEQASALNKEYLKGLGTFDVVYSWGVLHHTGAMWDALENMTGLVREGGQLLIAIYNDQGFRSEAWRLVKKSYNHMPSSLRFVILWPVGAGLVLGLTAADLLRLRRPRVFSRTSGARGMSLWRDIVDWVGGYPFEVASRGRITSFYEQRGFRLTKLISCGGKLGCNQFLFTRCGAETDAR
jgi:2-polyprenyl-3-methyl-5-hydroxy-6-metoxy-1,4-benzoquinol methylase